MQKEVLVSYSLVAREICRAMASSITIQTPRKISRYGVTHNLTQPLFNSMKGKLAA